MSSTKLLWSRYKVIWDFPGNLFGSVPKNKELIGSWLETRRPKATTPNARSIPEIQEEVMTTLLEEETPQEAEQRVALGFQSVEGQLAMRGATIRAHLKDCGRIVGTMYVGKIEKEKSLGWKITNGLYVEEYWVPIVRPDGGPVREPDGKRELMVHAMTRMGPVNSLKVVDFVSNVRLTFTLRLLCGIKVQDVETIMQYGSVHGYAGERSMGEGRYIYSLEEAS